MTVIFIPNLDPSGGATTGALESTQLNVEGHVHSIDGKITACNTGAIAGAVTANAGTNLNTSALAVESGGNLDTIAGDTTSIDAKLPSQLNSSVPVTNIATDMPVAWGTKEYTDAATTITIVYKKSTVTVATRVITWASAALKTAGALPASNVVTLAGA